MAKQRPRHAGRQKSSETQTLRPANDPSPSWHYRLGRLLQFVGLLILPFGIASELVGRVGLGQSLLIAGAGTLVFYVGYLIQNRHS